VFLDIMGDETAILDTRQVIFLIPPHVVDPAC